ncbi:hypothetical protein AWZ03_002219 [Drosophila navojoa]|uniref:RING-type domain-containing protein n=1 Tax=Drosophila navojoa TaxID=7232 RepID=A0A484BRX9_DRONA|nr:hypothetical protein AWZ03_002219 [Drosophila navojoa]
MKTNPYPCIFCLDELQRPCRLPCSHAFCTDCLERYLQVRGDPRCPLCRRVFQVSAREAAEASNDSTTDPDTHVVPAAMSATPATPETAHPHADADVNATANGQVDLRSSDFMHLLDIDIDMLNDTLVLTLTEQEIRLFANLYDEVLREDQRHSAPPEPADAWSMRGVVGI